MKNTIFCFISLIFFTACEIKEKIFTTEKLINKVAVQKNCNYTFKVTESTVQDVIEINVKCDTNHFAYFSSALYNITQELLKNDISYDAYKITRMDGQTVLELDNSTFKVIEEKVKISYQAINLLSTMDIDGFISMLNPQIDLSDTSIVSGLKNLNVPKNLSFAGYDIIDKEAYNTTNEFWQLYFLNKDYKQFGFVFSSDASDKTLYGIHEF